jgi:hypothetical protein
MYVDGFDAHERAFAFFRGARTRGIYDSEPQCAIGASTAANKTAVETVFAGRDRLFNRRFARMCSHHLVDPLACTPAAGWGWAGPWPKAAQAGPTDRSRTRSVCCASGCSSRGCATAVLSDGLVTVEAACAEALAGGVFSSDVILDTLARRRQTPAPVSSITPDALARRHAPLADCARYDRLRSLVHGAD